MKRFLICFFIVLFFSVALILDFPLFKNLELQSIDWRFKYRKPANTSQEIVVVSVDEKSLHREGRWPWPRKKIAELISKINSHNPKMIGLDVIFAEPDVGDDDLKQALHEKQNVVLGYYFYNNLAELENASLSSNVMAQSVSSISPTAMPKIEGFKTILREMSGVVANIPSLTEHAKSQGFFNTLPDRDGVIRKAPLFLSYQGQSYPSLALEMFSLYRDGFDPLPIWSEHGILQGVNIKTDFVPTDAKGDLWINYSGHKNPFTVYSATDILHDEIQKTDLENKTVLLGATAVGIYDLRVTPISPVMPGVFVQADLLDMLYRQDFLKTDAWMKFFSLVSMLVMSAMLFVYLSKRPLIEGVCFALVLICIYGLGVFWAFQHRWVLYLITPCFNSFTLSFAVILQRGLTEELEKRKIRKAFQSYLHPAVIEQITKDPDQLKLGGKRAFCTVLFSDVRNFTSISEKMDPVVLVDLMNEYFDPIAKEIIERGGYVDKFIGDAVMAVFGVPIETPDHALKACEAALAMQKKVTELEPHFQKKFGITAFKTGIGIHTGYVTVGNIGTSQRLNYTVMGDTVNLASRLESATKELKVTIAISQKTKEELKEAIPTRFVDEIKVKGKEEATRVFEI